MTIENVYKVVRQAHKYFTNLEDELEDYRGKYIKEVRLIARDLPLVIQGLNRIKNRIHKIYMTQRSRDFVLPD